MTTTKKKATNEIRLIEGGMAADDRGAVSFVNDFDFSGVKRFYMVTNHHAGFVRAWHAHRHEAKYITVLRGAAVIGAVKIDNWKSPSRKAPISRYVLSAQKPTVMYIPAGHANGLMSLTDDTIILVFSTASLDESREDDIRYDARYWDIWQVSER